MDPQTLFYPLVLLLFLASTLFLKSLTKAPKSKTKKLPPGPWRLPIIGHLHLLNLNKPRRSLLSLSNKHGPLMFLHLGSIPTLIVSSADIAGEIFTHHDIAFSGRRLLTGPKKLFYNASSMLFAPHGEQWRQARKIAMLELLGPRPVRYFEAVRREEVEKLVAAIRGVSVANLSELTLSLANNVVSRVALGDESVEGGYGGKGGARLRRLLSETQRFIGGFCAADLFPGMDWIDRLMGFHARLEKNFEDVDEFFNRVISDHLIKEEGGGNNGDGEKEDMMKTLLRLHKAAVLSGGFLSSMDHVKAVLWVSC